MKPVVIKIGTGVLTREEDSQLDRVSLTKLVTAVAELVLSGQPCVLVSSGAVGAGISQLGLTEYPADIPTRQACAAVGQTRLMHAYENLFNNFDLNVAQLLLTADEFRDPERLKRVKNTLDRLAQSSQIVPIINENDSVAVEELSFGDNDMLSARVAELIGASQLILLSNIDGLLAPDSTDVVGSVEDVDHVLGFVREDKGKFSIGGMASKLNAVRVAVNAGVETVIAHGKHPERLSAITQGAGLCTRFYPR